MGLQFIGEVGVHLRDRNALKITAVDGDRVVDCRVMPSALKALGCHGVGAELVRNFQRQRDIAEIAAMVKYRRALAPTTQIEIEAADIAAVLPATAA